MRRKQLNKTTIGLARRLPAQRKLLVSVIIICSNHIGAAVAMIDFNIDRDKPQNAIAKSTEITGDECTVFRTDASVTAYHNTNDPKPAADLVNEFIASSP